MNKYVKQSLGLVVPTSFFKAKKKEIEKIVNGAGPKGWGWLVPDTLYGLSVTAAANIHDWEYYKGKTKEDKKKADDNFYKNMIRIIEAETSNWLLKKLRTMRAKLYFWAVKHFGQSAFESK
jgi:hypothetical protein